MEETIEKINYNNFEYILVNDDLIKGKYVYHFLNTKMIDYLINDELFNSIDTKTIPIFSLFCTKEDDKYIPIEDKKEIRILLEKFGMMPELIIASGYTITSDNIEFIKNIFQSVPMQIGMTATLFVAYKGVYLKSKRVKGAERDKFIEEQKENFRDIKQKFGIDIDLDKIDKRLDKIKLNSLKKTPRGTGGYYHPIDDSVNIPKYYLEESKSKGIPDQVRFHETIHYIAGRRYNLANVFSKFLIEGATQNLVVDYLSNNYSTIEHISNSGPIKRIINEDNIKSAKLQYNFDDNTGYKPFVSLVKQLEYVTGEKSYDSAINGNNHFIKAIAKELGKVQTMKLFAETNKMMLMMQFGMPEGMRVTDFVKKQQKLQDMILRVSFDKKFENINSVQDAQKYLEELRGFENYRTKITYLKENGDIEPDDTYKKYYQERYEELKDRFRESAELLEGYEYQEPKYKDTIFESDLFEKKQQEFIRHNLIYRMIENANGNINEIPRNVKISVYKTDSSYYVDKINDEDVVEIRRGNPGQMFIVGATNDFEWQLVNLRNPDKSEKECIKLFLEQVGAKKEIEEITFSEEEIIKTYDRYKKMQQLNKRIAKGGNLTPKPGLKKITFIDRIKNRMYAMLNKNRSSIEHNEKIEQESETLAESKKTSWDLGNWGDETKDRVEGETRKIIEEYLNNSGAEQGEEPRQGDDSHNL